ncbi:hypothetical protein BJ138DRAFT_1154876 [Hygrophoropsis aurantiaca]|uniref:Uncharacterized protein n=1 Tax=Hygrophoropsis aurantiaca TaxID=72124 RepID=A0ACB8A8K4_9AGAM|nr:hypothetical protein BJ138DRAFT_1154876 [Hygrophoropsis aurantiaca]
MSQPRRTSFSVAHGKRTSGASELPLAMLQSISLGAESEEWINAWSQVNARELIDSRIVDIDAETSVEDACDLLLSEDIPCLAVKSLPGNSSDSPYIGLFDFSDVNAFLTLAATRHTISPEELRASPRVDQIVSAARAGRVPVHLVSNLSEKNFLETLPYEAALLSLLSVFSRGTHRVLIRAPAPSEAHIGIVSDRRLLSWFSDFAQRTPSFQNYLSNSLYMLHLPSLHMYVSVVAATASDQVLDAMRLMSEQGVSSVAVVDEELGTLLSAVSVTDIGKIVVPSQSNQILSTPLHQFISQIKAPDGSTDGVDKYPVYVVFPNSTLSHTIQKLLATNSHRLFVTDDSSISSSPTISGAGGLCGIVSIVDILSLFARVANIPDVDPTQRMRHRRASSSSSHSSRSSHTSRSNSRTSIRRLSASPRIVAIDNPRASPMIIPVSSGGSDNPRNSVSSLDAFQWSELVSRKD